MKKPRHGLRLALANKTILKKKASYFLPDSTVLTVDSTGSTNPAEKFLPSTKKWVSASTTGARLYDPGSEEIGPEFLLPNGTVFATGANASGGGNTSVYTLLLTRPTQAAGLRVLLCLTTTIWLTPLARFFPTATC